MSINKEEEGLASSTKKKILSDDEYTAVCNFIFAYKGLAIDCTIDMIEKHFKDIDPYSLKCIVQAELFNQHRNSYWRYDSKAKQFIERFEHESQDNDRHDILLNIAKEGSFSPVSLCRAILKEKYHYFNKYELSSFMKYPSLIPDPKLAANVIQCLFSDSQDGPLVDLKRRIIGEEYEVKLKDLAKKAGLYYYDETDLRRLGYDKTPDIKMILPFMYKGEVIHWIESKATFGDLATHRYYIEQQLNSYCNRFGSGIIIYWFGYHADLPQLPDNSIGITILDDFPDTSDITVLNVKDIKPQNLTKTNEPPIIEENPELEKK